MPELPEVEVLVRQLRPLIVGKRIRNVEVRRPRVVRPSRPEELSEQLLGARFESLERRGKYMLFILSRREERKGRADIHLVGHLGMTGRMYLLPRSKPLPKHASVVLDLGSATFVFEDTRYFGRFCLDTSALDRLGPEPLAEGFDLERFERIVRRSSVPIKVKLLDQSLVAGIGNIYASEALFLAGISPRRKARSLRTMEIRRLMKAVRKVLSNSIQFGSTVTLNFGPSKTTKTDGGAGQGDRLFYYGRSKGRSRVRERLRVYNRAGKPCPSCGESIRRLAQAGRSTFFCKKCQT